MCTFKLCNHGSTSEYVENLFSMGYLQIITKPTRCSGPSATLIDHILTNEAKNSYNSGLIINRISDHFPIFHELSDKKTKTKQSPIYRRNFCDHNIELFNHNLRAYGFRDVLATEDPQLSTDLFINLLLSYLICTFH